MAVATVGSGVVGTDTVGTGSAAPAYSVNVGLRGTGALTYTFSTTSAADSGSGVAKVGSGVVGTNTVGTGTATPAYSVATALTGTGTLSATIKSASGTATGTAPLTGSGALTSTASTTNAYNDPVAPIPDIVARYRADSVTGLASGTNTTAVPDTSGNNYNLSQHGDSGNPFLGPVWVSGVLNGQPVFRFTGIEALRSQAPAGDPQQTLIAVMRSSGTDNLTIRGSDRSSGLQFRISDNAPQLLKQYTTGVGTGQSLSAGWHVVIATYDSARGSTFRVDGMLQSVTGSTAVGLEQNALTVFGKNGTDNGETFNGDIAELLVYDRVLSTNEQATIDGYVQKRYGIAVSDTSDYFVNIPLSGRGSLATTPVPRVASVTSLTSTGSLTTSLNSLPAYSTTVNFSGSGALSTSGRQTPQANAPLSGAGTLTVSGTLYTPGYGASNPAITGNGALTVVSKPSGLRTVTLSGSGSLSAGGGQLAFANAALNGNGALNTSVTIRFPAGAALFGQGGLTAQRYLAQSSDVAALSGNGSLNAYGRGGLIGVPAPGVLAIKNNRNITGYSVEENATPINAASTEGGVGTISFGFPQRSGWLGLFEQDIELDDDFRGTTSGKISAVHAENGLLSITADNRLSTLVGETQALPMDGTFEAVARYYLKLGQITDGIYFHKDVRDIPVTTRGWHGDAWLNLKQLCTVYDVEVSLVSNNVTFRPVRSLVVNPRKLVSLTEDLESADIARTVEVTYYENTWRDGELVYPRTPEEVLAATVYQVEANSVIEDDIQLTVSLASIMQPVCVIDVAQSYDATQSVYSVRAVDNSQVTPQQWNEGGGKIELTLNEDTTSVHIKITGPRDQYYGPYRICGRVKEVEDLTTIILPPGSPSPNADADAAAAAAAKKAADDAADAKKSKGTAKRKPVAESAKDKAARLKKEAQEKEKARIQAEYDANKAFDDPAQSEEDYPSLRLVGTGTHIDKQVLTLPTGVPAWRTASDVGATVENVYVTSLEDAYNVGTTVAAQYRGEQHTITATLGQINQRMGSGTIAYRTVGDIEDQYRGMTIGDFEAVWAGKRIRDFNAAQAALVVDNFDNQVFGNVPGTRFQHGAAFFRVTDATTTESDITITAVRDTMLGDFSDARTTQTIADFNTLYAGKTLKEFGRIPLLQKDA